MSHTVNPFYFIVSYCDSFLLLLNISYCDSLQLQSPYYYSLHLTIMYFLAVLPNLMVKKRRLDLVLPDLTLSDQQFDLYYIAPMILLA